MATSTQVGSVQRRSIANYPASNLKFDLFVAALTFYFLCGLFLDGWAHNAGEVDNSFFTPWHAVLYSGFGLIGLTLVVTQFLNVQKGHAWTRALPKGYGLALVGIVFFGFGGGFDFAWHNIFGFEVNVEALLSPAHLLLATGALLFVTAPLRAAWMRKGRDGGWAKLLPAMISIFCVFMVISFFMQYSHYLGSPYALTQDPRAGDYDEVFNIYQFLTPAVLLMSMVLFTMRRWDLPRGFLTLVMVVQTLLMFWLRYSYVEDFKWLLFAPIIGGIIGDGLLLWLKPSAERVGAMRIFAFALPFIINILYFAILIPVYGTHWPIHMWLGVTFLSGFIGLFLSFMTVPPNVAQTEE